MRDVVADMGPAFLGTRLKRLAERMQAGANQVVAAAGLPLQSAHMPILAALRTAPHTIGQLAEAIGMSQPGVTRSVDHLAQMGLVADAASTDQRTRRVALTEAGRACAARAASDLWPRIGMAAQSLLGEATEAFMAHVAALEAALETASIAERASAARPAGLVLRDYAPALAPAFRAINAQWITAMFALEAADNAVLDDPEGQIIAPGGAILFVEAPGLGVVGTCALRKTGAAFELTKMGVLESARGLKAGEFLLAAAIARARALGADPLYLLTNSACVAAIHLYEKLGFVHDTAIMATYGARYARCDVAMRFAA